MRSVVHATLQCELTEAATEAWKYGTLLNLLSPLA